MNSQYAAQHFSCFLQFGFLNLVEMLDCSGGPRNGPSGELNNIAKFFFARSIQYINRYIAKIDNSILIQSVQKQRFIE
jgi:hypothetical protein